MLDNKPFQSELLDRVLHTKLRSIDGMRYSRNDIAFKSRSSLAQVDPIASIRIISLKNAVKCAILRA